MNIHEHQAKELLRRYGVAVPDGEACFTVDAAVAAANRLGFPCVVKAQIHAGGRGKAGGVQVVRDGGEAEAAAARTPEKILRETIDPAVGFAAYQGRRLAFGLGLTKEQVGKAVGFMTALARCFVESDCSLAEINPLVVTADGGLLALDAKIGFDDNGLFRHPELRELRDPSEEDPREQEAAKHDLSYIALDGNIGCM